jgi:AraC family transcriptional regulator of adaptative response/methylated-DNA-[protein]-cysteine methyltransferase
MTQTLSETKILGEQTQINDSTRWQAVQNRDASYNGAFVYAVRSTGIYCLPSCPSRRPRLEQVTFYASCDEAETAGFRPCKRCHPRDAMASDQQAEIVRQACALIDASLETPPSLQTLSQALNFSPSHLHRLFKAVTGLTPHQYTAGQRLVKFKSRVRSGANVTAALYDAGYGSASRLYEGASAQLGMTPAAYRKGGQGIAIRFTVIDTALGRMLVAGTERGICAVSFGDDDAKLEAFLLEEYPAAAVARDDAFLKPWASALHQHLAGHLPHLDLPVDVQATAFQLKVWETLRRIPHGETRTYTQVAEAIGRPNAVRAVANACAANPAAVVTPCHRVVRSDGGLGGYRWGIERKKALLKTEQG